MVNTTSMKKYVLNIEKMFSGQTANALVLSQVNEDMPVLLPLEPPDERIFLSEWIERLKSVNPRFDPSKKSGFEDLNLYEKVWQMVSPSRMWFEDCIMEFNLKEQQDFKERASQELYMLDDTQWMKPNESTFSSDKTYMHCINGLSEQDGGNSSQMNVLFPFKKMSRKSMYASQVKVPNARDMDDILERAM